MRFAGKLIKERKGGWSISVDGLCAYSQGTTRKEAFAMIADAIEGMVNKPGFKVEVFVGAGGYFEVGANDPKTLLAFFIAQQRGLHEMSLAEVAKKLGRKSRDTYAKYEKGVSVPAVTTLGDLLSAFGPNADVVIGPSAATRRAA
jgi:hypothetical protein